jgi:hypothetical protein
MNAINPFEDHIQPLDGLFNKLFSAATAAPRFINSLVSGDVRNFEVFEDQSIGETLKEKFGGELVVGSAVLASQGINTGSKPKNPTTITSQSDSYQPGNTQGGYSSQVDWRSLLASQNNSQEAGVSSTTIGLGLLLLAGYIIYNKEREVRNKEKSGNL